MSSIILDFVSGWRVLIRQWRSSLMAVIAIALAIGSNTAVFSVVRGVLLRPLPYEEPDRLVMIWNQTKQAIDPQRIIATPSDLTMWRMRGTGFADVAALEMWNDNPAAQMDIASNEGAERLRGAYVTPNLFQLLGVRAALGRTFGAETDDTDVVVLSNNLWQRRFGGDFSIVGREIRLALGGGDRRSRPFRVIGVLPRGIQFTYPSETEVWVPRTWREAEAAPRSALLYRVIARLRPGVSVNQAQRDMVALSEAVAKEFSNERFRGRYTIRVEPIREWVTGQIRPLIALISAIAGTILLIACVNVASVLLARTTGRRRELAIRAALGASQGRLLQQLLTEGVLLSTLGGAIGLCLLFATHRAIVNAIPLNMPRADEISIDWWVVAGAVLTIMATGLLASIIPSWHGSRLALRHTLNEGGLALSPGVAVKRWRHIMITLQVVVVYVLLVSGGLLLHSFWNLQRVDLGFSGDDVLTMEMRLLGIKYRNPRRLGQFQEELLSRVRALAGVRQVSMTSSIPMRGVDWKVIVTPDDGRPETSRPKIPANLRQVDWQYFSVMHISLRAGRLFSSQDTTNSLPVAIISQSLAARLFPNENAVGKRLAGTPSQEVVGVVGDVRHVGADDPASPALYVPRTQEPSELICLVILPEDNRADLRAAVLATIRSIDPEQPVERITTLNRIVAESIENRRFYTSATAVFAILGLLLAIVGVYGVMTNTVTERGANSVDLRTNEPMGNLDSQEVTRVIQLLKEFYQLAPRFARSPKIPVRVTQRADYSLLDSRVSEKSKMPCIDRDSVYWDCRLGGTASPNPWRLLGNYRRPADAPP